MKILAYQGYVINLLNLFLYGFSQPYISFMLFFFSFLLWGLHPFFEKHLFWDPCLIPKYLIALYVKILTLQERIEKCANACISWRNPINESVLRKIAFSSLWFLHKHQISNIVSILMTHNCLFYSTYRFLINILGINISVG